MRCAWLLTSMAGLLFTGYSPAQAGLTINLGPEQIVQASKPSVDLQVEGYSVPSFCDWNNDGRMDLVIGEGDSFTEQGKVRVYLNVGSESNPAFGDYFYAQSNGQDLVCPAYGCLGCFPRAVYWDADGRKDLLIGQSDGYIKIYLNINTDDDPTFDQGSFLQVGTDTKLPINVGLRATPVAVDWNNDSKKDIVCGDVDGKFHLFINEGSDTEPDFLVDTFVLQQGGYALTVPARRSSPHIVDLTGDGKKDILTGDTEGQLLLYENIGTDAAPQFSNYILLKSDGVTINLPDTPRSRPFVCDWTQDGFLDIIVGAGDGLVHLYQTVLQLGDTDYDFDVDMDDFATFSSYWCWDGCNEQNNFCQNCDFLSDGTVGFDDLLQFADFWLAGLP